MTSTRCDTMVRNLAGTIPVTFMIPKLPCRPWLLRKSTSQCRNISYQFPVRHLKCLNYITTQDKICSYSADNSCSTRKTNYRLCLCLFGGHYILSTMRLGNYQYTDTNTFKRTIRTRLLYNVRVCVHEL